MAWGFLRLKFLGQVFFIFQISDFQKVKVPLNVQAMIDHTCICIHVQEKKDKTCVVHTSIKPDAKKLMNASPTCL